MNIFKMNLLRIAPLAIIAFVGLCGGCTKKNSVLSSTVEVKDVQSIYAYNLIFSTGLEYEDWGRKESIVWWSFLMYLHQSSFDEIGTPHSQIFLSILKNDIGLDEVKSILLRRVHKVERIGDSAHHGNTVGFDCQNSPVFIIPGKSPVLRQSSGPDTQKQLADIVNQFVGFLDSSRVGNSSAHDSQE